MILDILKLRDVLGSFLTGVTIITMQGNDGVPRGITANSFTSVSLDPPLILVCISRTSSSFEHFNHCRHFAVNVLAEYQRELSSTFAKKGIDKFSQTSYFPDKFGSPIFTEVVGWLSCSVDRAITAGDHIILIGRVEDLGQTRTTPLGYFKGQYVVPGVVDALRTDNFAILGCLATYRDRLFLLKSQDGRWGPPLTNRSNGTGRGRKGLLAQFVRFGAPVDLSFLYSVWESARQQAVFLFYRGIMAECPVSDPAEPSEIGLFQAHDLPWDLIDPDFHQMLSRFVSEMGSSKFGMYTEIDETTGVVKGLSEDRNTVTTVQVA